MTLDRPGVRGNRYAVPAGLLEHARRFRAEGRTPATPRVAATVLLVRPAPGAGFEVYLIRRAVSMTFGGVYAFPGGGVDPADAVDPADSRRSGWSGPDPRWWGTRLGVAPAAARAVVRAAAREVFEEAGVLLAGPRAGTVVGDVSDDDWEAARRALVERRISFTELLRRRRLTLRSDLLLLWSRWITPEFEPRRFDTYFFVALLPDGQRTRDVSGEADHTMWVRPVDALARAEAGEISMLPPTRATLAEVAACPELAMLPRVAESRDGATPVQPRLELPPHGEPYFVLD